MRTATILALIIVAGGLPVRAQSNSPAQTVTELLQLTEGDRVHEIGLQVTVDQLSYSDYWAKTVDAIFAFADSNSDGVLSDEEVKLVPSARAVRLSLGSGFTPPVAAIQSLADVVTNGSQTCSKEDLQKYYQRHGVGRVTIGYGKLPNTAAITTTIVQSLDIDRDGKLSQGELQKAETTLRRLDANDDELIGVGELVPNGAYPGNWAANALQPTTPVDLSLTGNGSVVLKRIPSTSNADAAQSTSSGGVNWQIAVSDQIRDVPLKVSMKVRCESWSIRGPLASLFDEFSEEVMKSPAEPPAEGADATTRRRGRGSNRAWLTPLVDRDRNGEASQQEINQWLDLQRQIVHGQVLVSIYHGGGLFELLDTNHDAGLSIRELREAWQTLEAASCVSATDKLVDVDQVPNVLLFVVSQGYPETLSKASNSSNVEWFRQMDRNSDGDVSRREFTGTSEAFSRLDLNRDGLISASEAASVK